MAILAHAIVLLAVSLVPLWFGEGLLYGLGASVGGFYFVWKSVTLYRDPSKANAIANFLASLVQLALLVAGALLESAVTWVGSCKCRRRDRSRRGVRSYRMQAL